MTRSFTSSDKYPTLYQILFSPHTPYVPPHASPIVMFVWKQRIWVESTFCLVSLEPWEKYLVAAFLLIVFVCTIYVGLVTFRIFSILGFRPAIVFPHDTTTLRNITSPMS